MNEMSFGVFFEYFCILGIVGESGGGFPEFLHWIHFGEAHGFTRFPVF